MKEVWTATDELAFAFGASPLTGGFRAGLAPTPSDARQGIAPGSIADLLAAYGMLRAQPLLLGIRLIHLPEFGELHAQREDMRDWLSIAERFAHALLTTIEFLRSRLPGYPQLLVPDTQPTAPRVRNDGFWDMRFPWTLDARRAAPQLRGAPSLGAALQLRDGSTRSEAALQDLLEVLQQSSPWRRFEVAASAIDAEDREAAKDLKREYRAATTDDRLDAVAGETGMRRTQMLWSELGKVKAGAGERLADYFVAFDELDEALQAVTALISHRVAKGDLPSLDPIDIDWGPPAALRHVRFRGQSNEFFHSLELAKIDVEAEALAGVVLLRNLTLLLDQGIVTAGGLLLSGSASLPIQGP